MKTWQWFCLAAMACGATTAARGDELFARRVTQPPAIDGDLADWKDFPQIKVKHPGVPDLGVPHAAMGWDDNALYLSVRVQDATVVNAAPLAKLTSADSVELRIAAPDRSFWLKLAVAPSSAENAPACSLAKISTASKTSDMLFATTEANPENGTRWAVRREAKHWVVEASVPFTLLGITPTAGTQLPFVLVVWDRDRADIDEWRSGDGWHKRAESSSQKAAPDKWPVITLGSENVRDALKIKSGVNIARHAPCNLFVPGEDVVFDVTLKGFPEGAGTAEAVVKDAFGVERLRVSESVQTAKSKPAEFTLNLGKLGRGYYELALTVTVKDAEGRDAISAGTATLGVMEQTDISAEEFIRQDRRFGLKWWGGVTDKPETIDMMCRLGLLWTRAITGETVQITTNSALVSVVKIERFPKDLFDEERYGALPDWEKKFGRGAWTLKTVPRENDYKAWLANDLKRLPKNQHVFEIWNEPWDKMSAEDFSLISKWIREIVTQVRPDARLGPNLRGDMSEYGYDAKVIAAGGMDGMDLVCLHPYASSENRAFLRAYRKWISDKVGRPIDIYITEYGSHSTPQGPAKRSEVEQAAAVVRQSLALYAEDCKALVPHWVGQSERNPTYHEDWFGFIRKNQQPKPVLLAHANSARLVDGGKYLGDLWFGPGVGAMVFRKDNENRLALFTRGEKIDVDVDTGAPEITRVDLFGTEQKIATQNGRVTLSVGANPVFLCGLSDTVADAASPELRDDRWPKPAKPPRNFRAVRRMNTPVFDGKFDDWNTATQLYIQNQKVAGDDASGFAYLAWNNDFLLVGVDMRDNEMVNRQPRAKLYREDSIELFVSTEVRDANPGYGPHDTQLFLTPTSGEGVPVVAKVLDREAGVLGDVAGAKYFLGKTPKGWAGEIALPWSTFPGFKPQPGAKLALELRVNDADTSHPRWKLDPIDVGFVYVEDPSTWSVLELKE